LADINALDEVEKEVIELYRRKLKEGKIRPMELRLLLDVLKSQGGTMKADPLDELDYDLPFESEDTVVQ
jgi:hypothetical protein